jgi:hypothetical protein
MSLRKRIAAYTKKQLCTEGSLSPHSRKIRHNTADHLPGLTSEVDPYDFPDTADTALDAKHQDLNGRSSARAAKHLTFHQCPAGSSLHLYFE